jgi:hypothetical protein
MCIAYNLTRLVLLEAERGNHVVFLAVGERLSSQPPGTPL